MVVGSAEHTDGGDVDQLGDVLLDAGVGQQPGAGDIAVPELTGVRVLVTHEGGAVVDRIEGAVHAEDIADLIGKAQIGHGIGDAGVRFRVMQAIQAGHGNAAIRQMAGQNAAEIAGTAGDQDPFRFRSQRQGRNGGSGAGRVGTHAVNGPRL